MYTHSLERPRSASRGWRALAVTALLGATLAFGACADDDEPEAVDIGDGTATLTAAVTETPSETVATETATATESATGDATPDQTTTPPETIERDGVSFISPAGWFGNADTWTSAEGDATLLFATVEREAGVEPQAAMLPEGATNLDREEIETPLGPGALHTIELADEDVFERHAIVQTEERIYDWWLAAESVEALDKHQQALDEVLDSIIVVEE